jgi:hypothetical protein
MVKHENPERLGRFAELAPALVRFNHIASLIINADNSGM